MIISKIPYTLLGLRGLLTVAHRVLELLNGKHPNEPFIEGTVDKLGTARDFASNAVGTTRKALTTKTVTLADDDRDDSHEAIKYLIKGGLKRTNVEFKDRCERLYAILEKNTIDLARLPYAEETTAMHGLFRDLDTPEAQADLVAINGLDWYEELKSNQLEFEAAVQERGEERAAKDAPTVQEAFDELRPAVKSLFKVLDVAEENELIEGVDETIVLVNELLIEIINSYRRGTKSTNEEGEEEED